MNEQLQKTNDENAEVTYETYVIDDGEDRKGHGITFAINSPDEPLQKAKQNEDKKNRAKNEEKTRESSEDYYSNFEVTTNEETGEITQSYVEMWQTTTELI